MTISQQTKSFKGDCSLGAVALAGRSEIEPFQKCIAWEGKVKDRTRVQSIRVFEANSLFVQILLSWGSSAVL